MVSFRGEIENFRQASPSVSYGSPPPGSSPKQMDTISFTDPQQIDHFTVVCLVAWPLNDSEAGVDLILTETRNCVYYMQIATN